MKLIFVMIMFFSNDQTNFKIKSKIVQINGFTNDKKKIQIIEKKKTHF